MKRLNLPIFPGNLLLDEFGSMSNMNKISKGRIYSIKVGSPSERDINSR